MKKFWLVLIVFGVVVAVVFSYLSVATVNSTSEPGFCMKCHSMQPMGKSFSISMHGGNNGYGFKTAHCTDCHLPHNSTAGFLVAKGITGARDLLSHLGLIKKADFYKVYFESDRYVYDSGCLKCHQDVKNPEKAYSMDPAVRDIHLYYWRKKRAGGTIHCVECHNDYSTPGFAHPELKDHMMFQAMK